MCREIHVSDINVAVLDYCDEGYDIPRTHVEELMKDSENPFARAFDYGRREFASEEDEGSNDSPDRSSTLKLGHRLRKCDECASERTACFR